MKSANSLLKIVIQLPVLLLLCFLFTTHQLLGQVRVSFHCWIRDSSQEGIPYVPVVLIKEKKVLYQLTDSSGKAFFQNLDTGFYRLLIQTIGYQKVDSSLEIQKPGLAIIYLSPLTHALHGVEIKEFKSALVEKNGIFSFQVDSTQTTGKSLFDLLSQTPTIQEDNQTLSVLNRPIIVFLNGKRIFITGTELVQFLKGLPAQQIQKIQIIPFPGIKYNVPENSAIVNIITVRSRFPYSLLDASLSDEKGMGNTMDESFLFNHQGDRVQYALNLHEYFTKVVDLYNSDLTIPGKFSSHNQYRTVTYNDPVTNFYLTIQGKIDRKNSLSFSTFGFLNNGNPGEKNNCTHAESYYSSTLNSGMSDSISNTFTKFYYRNRRVTSVMSYVYQIDSALDDRVQIDISYIYDADHESNLYRFNQEDVLNNATYTYFLYNNYPKHDKSLYGSILINKNLSHFAQISAALNMTDNQVNAYKKTTIGNDANMLETDSSQTFNFRQHQRIVVAKVGLNNENEDHKFSYDIGARLYFTKEDAYKDNFQFYNRKYVNLIPSISASYSFTGLSLDYSLQSGNAYPDFWSVNPNVEYYNQKLITENNVYLKPSRYYQNLLNITYHNKHVFSIYDSYRRLAILNDLIKVDTSGNIYFTEQNISYDNLFFFRYQTSFNLFNKSLQFNPYILLRYQSIKAPDTLGGMLNKLSSLLVGLNSHFTLSSNKELYADINGYYSTGYIEGFYRVTKPYVNVSADIVKKIHHFSIRLYANDITRYALHQKREYITNLGFIYTESQYHDTRLFGIRISWNFGNQQVHVEPNKPEEVNEVENRL